ncbi:antirestriction protein [Brucella oryzae]|uniref:antirestriction protein n=1 Tax=Brucella oryzae TaxID=335286 RepID=UPI00086876B7|nr:antirestriction protein [Brucella oryzae]MBR7653458.1 antirestriction protein [Brucella oryzae]ODT78095.1 MAG: antirestriction protein [Pelagibacterium sp. SCN 64-44]
MSDIETTPRLATLVPEHRRETFLPTMFGLRHLIIAENTVYNLMGWLSPRDYGGGLWDFYEQDGQPLYLVPTSKPRYRISCETNSYEGDVSADAAGIIATLFTFSHLSFKYQSDLLAEGYDRLYAYAADHAEASEIFQAID